MSDNSLMNQLKANVKNHYENDSIIQLAMGIFKFNTYLELINNDGKILKDKKYGVINVLDDRYNFENFILNKSDIKKDDPGYNLTLWEPFFFVTNETNENDINFNEYRMAIRHNQPNGENNIICKLTLRNNKYKLEEVPDGKINAKKVGKYNIYEFFMGEIGEITHSEVEVKALKEAENATKRADVAEGQLAETKEQLTIEKRKADDAKAALDTANKELEKTTEQLKTSEKKLEEAKRKKKKTKKKKKKKKKEKKKLEKKNQKMKKTQKKLKEAKKKKKEAEAEQEKAQQELNNAADGEEKRIAQQKLEEAKRKKKEAEANSANIEALNKNLTERQMKSKQRLKERLEQQEKAKQEREQTQAAQKEAAQAEAATKIQSLQRGHSEKGKFENTLNMIKKIQAVERAFLTRREQKKFNEAAMKIQALQRGRHARGALKEKEDAEAAAATTIQSIYRLLTAKKQLSHLKEEAAATAIQAQLRGQLQRNTIKEEKLVEDIKQFLAIEMSNVENIINTEMVDSKKKNSIEEIKTKISDLLGNPSADKLEEVR